VSGNAVARAEIGLMGRVYLRRALAIAERQ